MEVEEVEITISRGKTPEEAIAQYRKSTEYEWLKKRADQLYDGYGVGSSPASNPFGYVQASQIELFNYAFGTISKIRTTPNPDTSPNDEYLLPFASKRNTKLLHHLLTVLIGNLSKDTLDVQFTRIDSFARDGRNHQKAFLRLAYLMKQAGLAQNEAAQAIGLSPEEVPQNMDQLRARLNIDPKLWDERDFSVAVQSIFEYCGMDTVMVSVILCLCIFGFAGVRNDNSGSAPEIRYMNPIMTRTNWSANMDYKDLVYFGEIILVPLSKFRHEAAGWLTEDEMKTVEKDAVTYEQILQRQGYIGYLGAFNSEFDGDKFIEVMDFEFKHSHLLTTKNKTIKGIPTLILDLKNSASPKHNQIPIYARYGGKYCCQSGLMYRCGRITPEPRQPMPLHPSDQRLTDHADVILGATFYRPMSLNGVSVSPVERVMEHVDSLQTLLSKRDNLIGSISPDLTAIDVDAIKEALTTPNAKGVSMKKMIQGVFRRGLVPYKGKQRVKMPNAGGNWPVQVIPSNTSARLAQLEAAAEYDIRQIRMLIGVPETLEGIMPGTRSGDKAMQNMNAAATESMEPIRQAKKAIFTNCSKFWLYTIQTGGFVGSYKGSVVNIDPDVHGFSIFNTKVIVDSSKERWAILMQAALEGHAKGFIPYSMIAYLQTESNIQTAELRYADFEQRQLQRQDAMAERNFMANAEDQQKKLEQTIAGKLEAERIKVQGIIEKAMTDAEAAGRQVAAKIMADYEAIKMENEALKEQIVLEKDLELRNERLKPKESTNE